MRRKWCVEACVAWRQLRWLSRGREARVEGTERRELQSSRGKQPNRWGGRGGGARLRSDRGEVPGSENRGECTAPLGDEGWGLVRVVG